MNIEHNDGNEQSSGISRLVAEAMEKGHTVTHNRGREAIRFSVGMHLEVTTNTANPSDTFMVTMHNVSDSGIAFWARKKLDIRTDIWIRESTEDNSAPWLSSHVTHCTAGLRGHLIGARFNATD